MYYVSHGSGDTQQKEYFKRQARNVRATRFREERNKKKEIRRGEKTEKERER